MAHWLKRTQELKTIHIDEVKTFKSNIVDTFRRARELGSEWNQVDRMDDTLKEIREL